MIDAVPPRASGRGHPRCAAKLGALRAGQKIIDSGHDVVNIHFPGIQQAFLPKCLEQA
jgi:hypothetical protein